MSERFTPGPWIVDFDLYDEEGPLDVPEVNGRILDQDNCVVCQASTEANVFLIHAAPEMYEALRAVDAWENPSCFEKVRAALKKARGEA
jgi:hypothetical protein